MRKMRKYERERPTSMAFEIFDRAPFVTVSMVRPGGTPYGLPLSLVRKDDSTFYFHCAFDGEKVDCLKANPVVSLSAVSRCTPKFEEESGHFTEYYNSAIALARASFVTDNEEKIMALRLLCERFLPAYMNHFDEAVEKSLDRTCVVRLDLTEPPVAKSKP